MGDVPSRIVVSFKAGALFALANIICVVIFSWAWMQVKSVPKEINVTGSAKRAIVSDLILWAGKVSVSNPDMVSGYDKLKSDVEKTLAWLRGQGIAEGEITVSSVETAKRFKRDEKGNPTDTISSYELHQTISITSGDVQKVAEIARKITALIKEGVLLESNAPSYHYTKLADLKVSMLADATKDATARAEQIASNSGAKLGKITDARMGVMQINAMHDTSVSGSGMNDTSSYEKQITAVVSARFALD